MCTMSAISDLSRFFSSHFSFSAPSLSRSNALTLFLLNHKLHIVLTMVAVEKGREKIIGEEKNGEAEVRKLFFPLSIFISVFFKLSSFTLVFSWHVFQSFSTIPFILLQLIAGRWFFSSFRFFFLALFIIMVCSNQSLSPTIWKSIMKLMDSMDHIRCSTDYFPPSSSQCAMWLKPCTFNWFFSSVLLTLTSCIYARSFSKIHFLLFEFWNALAFSLAQYG